VEFVVAGIDYSSLAASNQVMTHFTTKIAESTCSSVGLPAYNCSVVVFAGSVKVGVSIGERSSYDDASVITEAVEENKAYLAHAVVDSVQNDTQIMAVAASENLGTSGLHVETVDHIPQSDSSAGPSPAPGDSASATGDPHVASVTGQKFDVNLPGGYVLIRAPQDRRLPAKLEVNATLEPQTDGSPCGLYIKSIQLGGEWLAFQRVDVVPLQRDLAGGNSAGSRTVRPFSVRVQGSALQAASGEYETWKSLGKQGRLVTGRIRLVPAWRQIYADAGRNQEAEAFQFQVRGEGEEKATSFEVAQGAHQALDVRAGGLRKLGFQALGGLLGTEEHDKYVEQFTDECKAFRTRTRLRPGMAPPGSSMAASWD
jgi:hypothetical protein